VSDHLGGAAEVQHVPCAAGSEIESVNCRLSKLYPSAVGISRIGEPGGPVLQLGDSPQRIERFALPAIMPPPSAIWDGSCLQSQKCGYSRTIGRWNRLLAEQCVSRNWRGQADGDLNFDAEPFASALVRGHPDQWRDVDQTPNSVPADIACRRPTGLDGLLSRKTEIREACSSRDATAQQPNQ